MNTMTPATSMTKSTASSPTPKGHPAIAARNVGLRNTPITPDRIRVRAYEIYQNRNGSGGEGNAISDWVQAEREVNGLAPGQTAAGKVEIHARARGEALLASGK